MLVKNIYTQNLLDSQGQSQSRVEDIQSILPIPTLVLLMQEIGKTYCKEMGGSHSCCEFHKKAETLANLCAKKPELGKRNPELKK